MSTTTGEPEAAAATPVPGGAAHALLRPGTLLLGRAALVVLCASLAALSSGSPRTPLALAALAVVALLASVPQRNPGIARLTPVGEGVLAAAAIGLAQPLQPALLPYLLAPAVAAGVTAGLVTVLATGAGAATVLLLVRLPAETTNTWRADLGNVAQWVVLSTAAGALAAWTRRVQAAAAPTENAAYAAAYRLIAQLRLVSRQLSQGLDQVSLAQALLQSLRSVGYDRGGVYVRSPGGRLVPLAFEGAERLDWDTSAPEGSLFAEAWASGEPVHRDAPVGGGTARGSAALPLRIGVRTFGLVGLERDAGPLDPAALRSVTSLVDEAALRLETALLFNEVRSIATAEERRRVAREIHDGIAQELASIGYGIDELADRARFLPDVEESLKGLRKELSRVITELRLSIFDLRSDVHASTGLGTALGDYVRQVGAGSSLTVHLVLDEGPVRLPIETEAELLRISQEAVTNARKHANAKNLWVTCRVTPPSATIVVEDDGSGLGNARSDSFGLEIMRERAARIGARLDVRNRDEGGTVVQVTVGEH